MKVVVISSQIEEPSRILWVIDLKTLLLIKCELDNSSRNIRCNIGSCLEIDGKYRACGYPFMNVKQVVFLDDV